MRASAVSDVDLEWSDASVASLHAFFDDQYQNNKCLEAAAPGQPGDAEDTYQALCGNGIVELDEECDAGGDGGLDPCCDVATCQLKAGAACSSLDGCCTASCELRASGEECRASRGVCDTAEVCNGEDAFCPSDLTAANGQSCPTGVADFPLGLCSGGDCLNPDAYCFSLYAAKISQSGSDRAHRDTANECADFWCVQDNPAGGFQFVRLAGAPEGVSCNDNGGICRGRLCETNTANFPVAQWTISGWSACDGSQDLEADCTDEAGNPLASSACDHLPVELFSRSRSCTVTTAAATTTAAETTAAATTTTAATTTPAAGDTSESSGTVDATVIGGAVGGAVVVVLLIVGAVLMARSRGGATKTHPRSNAQVTTNPAFSA